MKITVGLPSRNRPAGLLSVLSALDGISSGQNQITYAVILDNDDYVTLEQFEHWEKSGMIPQGVQKLVGDRSLGVHARFNAAMRQFPADIYSQACDDAWPMAFRWDALLAGAAMLPAFSWQEMNDPENATYPIISHKWLEATEGRFYTEHFPFWFADTWIAEVFTLAFAKPIGVVNQLQMAGRRGQTQGMRELAFWFEMFAATRVERIEEARKIASAYGFTLNMAERTQQLEKMQAGDRYQLSRVPVYEAAFSANLGVPSKHYDAAKFRAVNWMAEHALVAA